MSAKRRRSRVTRRRWYLRPVPVAALLAALVFAGWFAFGESGLWDMHHLRQRKREQAERIRRLEVQKRELAAYLEALNARDERALERAAREHGMVAANETIFALRVEPDPPK